MQLTTFWPLNMGEKLLETSPENTEFRRTYADNDVLMAEILRALTTRSDRDGTAGSRGAKWKNVIWHPPSVAPVGAK
jgi:hypothetical protein